MNKFNVNRKVAFRTTEDAVKAIGTTVEKALVHRISWTIVKSETYKRIRKEHNIGDSYAPFKAYSILEQGVVHTGRQHQNNDFLGLIATHKDKDGTFVEGTMSFNIKTASMPYVNGERMRLAKRVIESIENRGIFHKVGKKDVRFKSGNSFNHRSFFVINDLVKFMKFINGKSHEELANIESDFYNDDDRAFIRRYFIKETTKNTKINENKKMNEINTDELVGGISSATVTEYATGDDVKRVERLNRLNEKVNALKAELDDAGKLIESLRRTINEKDARIASLEHKMMNSGKVDPVDKTSEKPNETVIDYSTHDNGVEWEDFKTSKPAFTSKFQVKGDVKSVDKQSKTYAIEGHAVTRSLYEKYKKSLAAMSNFRRDAKLGILTKTKVDDFILLVKTNRELVKTPELKHTEFYKQYEETYAYAKQRKEMTKENA